MKPISCAFATEVKHGGYIGGDWHLSATLRVEQAPLGLITGNDIQMRTPFAVVRAETYAEVVTALLTLVQADGFARRSNNRRKALRRAEHILAALEAL